VGVLGRRDHLSPGAAWTGRDGFEMELLLRATDWHIEESHGASGGFCREHIQAADVEEAKARAADRLCAFRAEVEGTAGV
jgi:hypothetical protein